MVRLIKSTARVLSLTLKYFFDKKTKAEFEEPSTDIFRNWLVEAEDFQRNLPNKKIRKKRNSGCFIWTFFSMIVFPAMVLAMLMVAFTFVGKTGKMFKLTMPTISFASDDSLISSDEVKMTSYNSARTKKMAKISHYWPPLGGTNCSDFQNGVCVAKTSSGDSWESWVDKGLACPSKYPFGTKFIVQGKTWTCVDRGGAIVETTDGKIWLDLLTQKPPVSFGEVLEVTIVYTGKPAQVAKSGRFGHKPIFTKGDSEDWELSNIPNDGQRVNFSQWVSTNPWVVVPAKGKWSFCQQTDKTGWSQYGMGGGVTAGGLCANATQIDNFVKKIDGLGVAEWHPHTGSDPFYKINIWCPSTDYVLRNQTDTDIVLEFKRVGEKVILEKK